ncbi:MAG: hypothetical protein WC696_00525 [Candidatus Methylopumilus sp.]|jgi:hypothetical protein
MASIALSKASIAALKKELHEFYSDIKSSHLAEAIANALDRNTYASLMADVKSLSIDPPLVLLHDDPFFKRLTALGYADDPEFSFELFPIPEIISTIPRSAYDIEYRSAREKAWRNIMVCGINEGLKQKLFSLKPNDNRWPGALAPDDYSYSEGHVFEFILPNGLNAKAYVNDASFEELVIHVGVNPKGDIVRHWNPGFTAGEAFAMGWLERRTGAWLQTTDLFHCRRNLLSSLASMNAKPMGYGDRGRVIM